MWFIQQNYKFVFTVSPFISKLSEFMLEVCCRVLLSVAAVVKEQDCFVYARM